MLRRSFALTAFLVASATALGQTPSPKAEESVRKLSSGRYQDRERATRELETMGDEAHDALKKAAASNEPEVRKRAEDLLQKIEERQTQAKLLAPKMVRLKVADMSVADAITELTKASGYPIQFQGDRTVISGRKITLDTGETTFWKAFDDLCVQGKLVEPTNVGTQRVVRGGYINGIPRNVGQQGTLQVTNGDPSPLRFAYAGAVRVRLTLIPAVNGQKPGYVIDASAEPRMQSFAMMHEPVIDRAIDELGQTLIPASALPNQANAHLAEIDFIEMPQGMGMQNRRTQLRFEPTAKPSTKVSLLKGTLSASMQVPDKELVVVKEVMKNLGNTVRGKDGSGLTVVSLEKVGAEYRARLRLEGTQMNMGNGGMVFAGAGQVVIQGNVIINGRMGGQQNSLPVLTDAEGKAYASGPVTQNSVSINNGSISTEVTLTYRGTNVGEPATMTLSGSRNIAVPVPFEFRDLPLR